MISRFLQLSGKIINMFYDDLLIFKQEIGNKTGFMFIDMFYIFVRSFSLCYVSIYSYISTNSIHKVNLNYFAAFTHFMLYLDVSNCWNLAESATKYMAIAIDNYDNHLLDKNNYNNYRYKNYNVIESWQPYANILLAELYEKIFYLYNYIFYCKSEFGVNNNKIKLKENEKTENLKITSELLAAITHMRKREYDKYVNDRFFNVLNPGIKKDE